jgi:hypothetical protein
LYRCGYEFFNSYKRVAVDLLIFTVHVFGISLIDNLIISFKIFNCFLINKFEISHFTEQTDQLGHLISFDYYDNPDLEAAGNCILHEISILTSKNTELMTKVDYLLGVIRDHGIEIDPKYAEHPPEIINEWSDDNVALLNTWEHQTTKSLFVYEYVLEKYRTKLNKWLTLSLLCTSISALLAGVSAALSAVGTYMWVVFAFNITILLVSGVGSFISGYINMNGWPDLVTTVAGYCQKLNIFLCNVKSKAILRYDSGDPTNNRYDSGDPTNRYDSGDPTDRYDSGSHR